jgi:hypothetical protein
MIEKFCPLSLPPHAKGSYDSTARFGGIMGVLLGAGLDAVKGIAKLLALSMLFFFFFLVISG